MTDIRFTLPTGAIAVLSPLSAAGERHVRESVERAGAELVPADPGAELMHMLNDWSLLLADGNES